MLKIRIDNARKINVLFGYFILKVKLVLSDEFIESISYSCSIVSIVILLFTMSLLERKAENGNVMDIDRNIMELK